MGRGRSAKNIELVELAAEILEEIQPCSVRAVCYKLFTVGIISSMAKKETNRVSRQLTWARENDVIPWSWIVDETRAPERPGTWADPEAFADAALYSFRRDRWEYQPVRVEVWSEKGTVRGALAPILDKYGITFRVFHGFNSATVINDIAVEFRDKPVRVFYVGDYDPSGLYMSEADLPHRLLKYGAHLHVDGECRNRRHRHPDQIDLNKVALLPDDRQDLPSFDVNRKDPRYRWYREHTGETRAWELDAMHPPDLRDRVEDHVLECIDAAAWERTGRAEMAEQASLRNVLSGWSGISMQAPE